MAKRPGPQRPGPPRPEQAPRPQPTPTPHHHRRPARRQAQATSPIRVNLTPMIDVIFLLLVYFVITANFAVGEGVLTASLPVGGSQPTDVSKPPQQPLSIMLGSAGASGFSVSVEGRRVETFTQLRALLEQLQYDPERLRDGIYAPDNPVLIRPDGDVRWQHVVNAFNAAVAARYANVSFVQVEH